MFGSQVKGIVDLKADIGVLAAGVSVFEYSGGGVDALNKGIGIAGIDVACISKPRGDVSIAFEVILNVLGLEHEGQKKKED